VHLIVSFLLRQTASWAGAGHEVAWFQSQLSSAKTGAFPLAPPLSRLSSELHFKQHSTRIVVEGVGFSFTFDKVRGYLTSWVVGGVRLLEADAITHAAIIPSFWRPPTDNDNPLSVPYWKRFGVDTITSQLRSSAVTSSEDDGSVVINTVTYLSPPVLDWGFEAETQYRISSSGTLTVTVHLKPTGYKPDHVPRVGLSLRLPQHFDAVQWHGLGPGESYPDKNAAQRVGIYTAESVAELQTPYEVPQENGNRMGTRWVRVGDARGTSIGVTAANATHWSDNCKRDFSWVATRHSITGVESAKHPCDLVEEEATLLRLDAAVAGVGTAACGPGVREDLLVKVQETRFAFSLEALLN
jgi:beta-galactosidase